MIANPSRTRSGAPGPATGTQEPCRAEPLSIFVHRASECLTDHESHGDGLICYSLLNGLARRGHRIYAYTDHAALSDSHPLLMVRSGRHRSPANSLGPWEQSWRAERWLRQLRADRRIDLVWRLHPYGPGCPYPPRTFSRPLVVGPLFYNWPQRAEAARELPPSRWRPRIGAMVTPLAVRGWQRTLEAASLILCATPGHAKLVREHFPGKRVAHLPVIVDPPRGSRDRFARTHPMPLRLLFVANLVPHKNPRLFCDIVKVLATWGIPLTATVLGDGPEREPLREYCAAQGIGGVISFQGKVPNQEVYEHLRSASFLVSTSVGEPYGRGIVEAMSVATPSVCHASGGPAEYIDDELDGLLISEPAPGGFARAIARVHHDPAAWQRLSRNAVQKSEEWTSPMVLSHLEEYLRRLCCDA